MPITDMAEKYNSLSQFYRAIEVQAYSPMPGVLSDDHCAASGTLILGYIIKPLQKHDILQHFFQMHDMKISFV